MSADAVQRAKVRGSLTNGSGRIELLEQRILLSGTPLPDAARLGLIEGLTEFAQWTDRLGQTEAFTTGLPLSDGATLGTVTAAGDVVQTYLVDRVCQVLQSPGATLEDVVSALRDLGGSFVGDLGGRQVPLDVLVDPAAVVGAWVDSEISFSLPFQALLRPPSGVDLDDALGALGFTSGAEFALDALGSLTLDLTFGFDLSEGLGQAEQFFLRPVEMLLEADLSGADFDLPDLRMGFMDLGITHGSISLSGLADVSFVNPDADLLGRITLDELRNTAMDVLAAVTPGGTLQASLPLSGVLGAMGLGAPQISLNCLDVFQLPVEMGFNADFEALLPLGRIDPAMVLEAFDSLGASLTSLQRSDVFARIEGLGAQKLSDLLRLGENLRGIIDEVLMRPIDGAHGLYESAFDSAQSLLERLAAYPQSVLSSSADYLDGVLTYTLRFAASDALEGDFAYDYSDGPLSLSATGTVSGEVGTEVALTLGLDLSALSAEVIAAGAAPVGGQLDRSAEFSVQVGSDAPVRVTVPAEATADNAGLDDLVADINAALADAGLVAWTGAGAVLLVEARRVTVETADGERQRIALRTLGPWVAARLSVTPGAGAGQLGFTSAMEDHCRPEDFAFVQDAGASASMLVAAQMPEGHGRLGMLGGITLTNGAAWVGGTGYTPASPVPATVSFQIGQAGVRYGLGDLAETIGSDAAGLVEDSLTTDVQAGYQFTVTIEGQTAELLGLDPLAVRSIEVLYPDVVGGLAPVISTVGMDELLAAGQQITRGQIVEALHALVDFLQGLESLQGPLSWRLPGTGLSVNEMVDCAQDLARLIERINAEGLTALNDSLSGLAATVRDVLGLAEDQFLLRIEPASAAGEAALRMTLDLDYAFDRQAAVNLDLETLMGASLWPQMADYTSILGESGGGTVRVDGSAHVTIDLGVGLSSLDPFLYEGTAIGGALRVQGRDLAFDLTLGPLPGMAVAGGHLLVGDCPEGGPAAYGAGEIPAAAFRVGLTDTDPATVERYYLSSIADSDVTGTLDAQVDLVLPFEGDWVDPADADLWLLAGVDAQGALADVDGDFPTFVMPDTLNLEAMIDGLRTLLTRLRDALGTQAFNLSLPIVGTQLNTAYLDSLLARLGGWSPYDALHAATWATNNLAAMFGASAQIQAADTGDMDAADAAAEWIIQLSDTYAFGAADVDFDLGLPGLGLDIDAHADVSLDWVFNLGLGFSKNKGFYLITDDGGFATGLAFAGESPTLGVALTAGVTDLDASGRLGFLNLTAEAIPGAPIGASGQFAIDLSGLNGRVYYNRLASSIYDVDVAYALSADVNARLEIAYSANFPSILSDLVMHWSFDNDDATVDAPLSLALEDIRIDLGGYLGGVVSPVVERINEVFEPLQPILNVLNTTVPVVSYVLDRDVTILDLAIMAGGSGGYDVEFLSDVAAVVDLAGRLPALQSHYIHLGTYTFGSGLVSADSPLDLAVNGGAFEGNENALVDARNAGGGFGAFLDDLQEIGIEIPLLAEPLRVVELFLGRDVELVQYTTPRLALDIDFRQQTPIIFPWLVFTIGMDASISAQAAFGYDTRGLRQYADGGDTGDLLNGFYMRTGPQYPLIRFAGHAALGLGVSLGGVVAAGVEGGIGLDGHIYATDADGDGRLHWDELPAFEPGEILSLFDCDGSIYFDVRLWWETPIDDGTYTLAKVTLMDFGAGTGGAIEHEADIEFDQRAMGNSVDLGQAPTARVYHPELWDSRGVQWYRFSTDRDNEVFDFSAVRASAGNDMALAVFNADGERLAMSAGWGSSQATLNDVRLGERGVYYLAVMCNDPEWPLESVSVTPNTDALTGTVVYYVNDLDDSPDPYLMGNPYTSAPGDDANSGLDPAHPKASISAVVSSLTGNEGRVYILVDSGHYRVDDEAERIRLAQGNVWFVGTWHTNVTFAAGPLFDLNNAGDVHLYGFNLYGEGTATAVRTRGDGLWDAAAGHYAPVDSLVIEGNRFDGVGVGIDAGCFQSVVISGNRFTGEGAAGVVLGTSAMAMVSGNSYRGYVGQYGLRTGGRFSAFVADNEIAGTVASVWADDGGSVYLRGNTISGSVVLRGDRDNVVRGNTITGDVRLIAPADPNWGQIVWPGEWVEANALAPLPYDEAFSQAIVGNVISGAVRVEYATATLIEGNVSLGSVVVAAGNKNTQIPIIVRLNESIDAGAGVAVEVTGLSWADITDNALIRGATGVLIDTSDLCTVSGNLIDATQYGLRIVNAGSMLAMENRIDAGVEGVRIEGNYFVRLEGNEISGGESSIRGIGSWVVPRVTGNRLTGGVWFEGDGLLVPPMLRRLGQFRENDVDGTVTIDTGHRLEVLGNLLRTGRLTVTTGGNATVSDNLVNQEMILTIGGSADVSWNLVDLGDLRLTVASGQAWTVSDNTLTGGYVGGGDLVVSGGTRAQAQGNTVVNGDLRVTITDAPTSATPASVLTDNTVSGVLSLVGGPGADIHDNPSLGGLHVAIGGAWGQADRAWHTRITNNPVITGDSHEGRGTIDVTVPGTLLVSGSVVQRGHSYFTAAGAVRIEGNDFVAGDLFVAIPGDSGTFGEAPSVLAGNWVRAGSVWYSGGGGLDLYDNPILDRTVDIEITQPWTAMPAGRMYHTRVFTTPGGAQAIGNLLLDIPGSAEVRDTHFDGSWGLQIGGSSLVGHLVENVTTTFGGITITSGPAATLRGNTVWGGVTVNVAGNELPAGTDWATVVEDNTVSDGIWLNLDTRAEVRRNTITESGQAFSDGSLRIAGAADSGHVVTGNTIHGGIEITSGPCATIEGNSLAFGSIVLNIPDDEVIVGQANVTHIRGNVLAMGGVSARLGAAAVIEPLALSGGGEQPNVVSFLTLTGSSAAAHQVRGNRVTGDISVSAGPAVVIEDNTGPLASDPLGTIRVRLGGAGQDGSIVSGNRAGTIDLQLASGGTIGHNTAGAGMLLTLGNAGGVLHNTVLGGGMALAGSGGDGHLVQGNVVTGGVRVSASAAIAHDITGNTISGAAYGLEVTGGAPATVHDNVRIEGDSIGIRIVGNARVTVEDNPAILGTAWGVWADGDGAVLTIRGNDIVGGVYVDSLLGALIESNEIHDGTTGVYLTGGSTDVVRGNVVRGFSTGVQFLSAAAEAYGNEIHSNVTGVRTPATLGGSDWIAPNAIHHNTVGVEALAGATVRFNRLEANAIGIDAAGSVSVHHNVLADNSAQGVLVDAASNVQVVNNTIVTADGFGDGVVVQGGSSGAAVRNNILWSRGGYGLYVANDSQVGLASDYNNLYASGSGRVVWYQRAYDDLLDWQLDSLYDAHSIGYTRIDPLRDDPRFVDPAGGDYRVQMGSTGIDRGDPASDFTLEPSVSGGRINLGAFGGTSEAAQSSAAYLRVEYPDFHADWQVDRARNIRWSQWNVAGDVRVEVYRTDGTPAAAVGTFAAAAGECSWSPRMAGLSVDLSQGYRVRVTSVSDGSVFAESREPFYVVPVGGTFYVNDALTGDDQYTTAAGDNRNPGLSPDAPKASVLATLRLYDLGAGDVIRIDDGYYPLPTNLLLGGPGSAGDDEGVHLDGPTLAGSEAVLDRVVTRAGTIAVDVNRADGIELRNLTIRNGQRTLWVREGSERFVGEHLDISGSALDGIRIESGCEDVWLQSLRVHGNGGAGVYAAPARVTLLDSEIANNAGTGVSLPAAGAARIEGNTVSGNAAGIVITHAVAGTTAIVGSLGHGNLVRSNAGDGITAVGRVLVEGNTVSGHTGAAGIRITEGTSAYPEANDNVVSGNATGIESNTRASVRGNLVYDNAVHGIRARGSETLANNVVHDSGVGIQLWSYYTGTIEHNVLYANATAAVRVTGPSTGAISLRHNTIHQTAGDGVRLETTADGVTLDNNIIVVEGGYGIYVSDNSQPGFSSDDNLLRATGGGRVGYWQGEAGSLAQWRQASGQDSRSLSDDPRFVNAAGGDYHLQSLTGSMHGGTLAVVLDGATGLPVAAAGTLEFDGAQSPAIDRGRAGSAYDQEPAPHGAFANLGAYGNTPQASRSPVSYVMLLTPEGGSVVMTGRSATVRWRSEGFTGAVDIELLRGGAFLRTVATGVANSGEYAWIAPADLPAGSDYSLRITRPGGVSGASATFSVEAFQGVYYVNDGSVNGDGADWTTAAGAMGNTGLSPDSPKASIAAVFESYELVPGDVIYVDAGVYTLSSNLLLTAAQSGIRIVGYHDDAHPDRQAVLDRANTLAGSYAIQLSGASGASLEHLSFTGAYSGIYAADAVVSDGIRIENCRFYGNETWGVWLGAGSANVVVEGSHFSGMAVAGIDQRGGVYLGGSGAQVRGSTMHDFALDWYYGIETTGADATVDGNTITNVFNGLHVTGVRSMVSGNTVSGGRTGMNLSGFSNVADWIEASGNIVHGQTWQGIYAGSGVRVVGNTVYNVIHSEHTGSPSGAIHATGDILDNVVYASTWGIRSGGYTGMTVRGNLVYGCTIGIFTCSGTLEANELRNNVTGIKISGYYEGVVRNNLIRDNTQAGLVVYATTPYGTRLVENNTFHQPTGDAIRLQETALNVILRNNIIHVGGGYGVYVSNDSQSSLTSDYNLIHTTGSGKAGYWQSDRATLADWRSATGKDAWSLSQDPLFVDPAGGDFHLQSPHGSYHGGRLAVALDSATGLPVSVAGQWVSDAAQSPAIDRGDAGVSYANEPAPNGAFVNLGAFGGTAQASRSPDAYLTVLSPSAGETWMTNRTSVLRWRSQDMDGAVAIELLRGGTVQSVIAASAPNSGSYEWLLPRELAEAGDYSIRITRSGEVVGQSGTFSIVPAAAAYYVNDGSVNAAGDWTTAAGNDAADGLTRSTPRSSIAAILASYQLSAGDVIYVDAGVYTLSSNLVLSAAQSGIRIVGYHDEAHEDRRAELRRGNTSSSSYAIQLAGAADVSLEHLHITGAYHGVYAANSAGATGLTILDCTIYGNSSYGVWVGTGNHGAGVADSELHGLLYNGVRQVDGVYLGGNSSRVIDSYLHGHSSGNSDAIELPGTDAVVSGNVLVNNHNGIRTSGVRARVSDNRVEGGQSGMLIYGQNNARSEWAEVVGNTVTGQNHQGIYAVYALVQGNTVYAVNHIEGSASGAIVGSGSEIVGNTVYDSKWAIRNGGQQGFTRDNVVYGNVVGLWVDRSPTEGNVAYSNGIGIQATGQSPRVANNLVYGNTSAGVVLYYTYGTPAVENNTVYQTAGDGVRLEGSSPALNVALRNNIVVMAGGNYALNISNGSQQGFTSDYNLFHTTGGARLALLLGEQYADVATWFYRTGYDRHSLQADPLFSDPDGADGRLGYAGGVNGGADDDFSLSPASPGVGAGDPGTYAAAQPPAGPGRITLGHQGNTAGAQTGSGSGVQVVSPNGLDRVAVGETVSVTWQSWGLAAVRPVAQVNAGGTGSGYWNTDVLRSGGTTGTIAEPVNTAGVTDPAPASVYASYSSGAYFNPMSYAMSVPDGTYTIRLHFVEPSQHSSVGSRRFDVRLQGETVLSNFDIHATAGGRYIAVARDFVVTASGGTGIQMSFVERAGYAILSAIEILCDQPQGQSPVSADLDLSTDGGATWSPLAAGVPMDRLGRGQYDWTVTHAPAADVRLRVTAGGVSDASDRSFQIVSAGNDYYVNDANVAAGDWTTAVGNDANSGKSPDAPMASLAGLLALYRPGAGDRVFVDAGTYNLASSLELGPEFTGVQILGYADANHPDRETVLDRNNVSMSAIVFRGADDVLLSDLAITGGYAGVALAGSADSDRVTLRGGRMFGNDYAGVSVAAGNDFVRIENVEIDGLAHDGVRQNVGIYSVADNATIIGNRIHGHTDVKSIDIAGGFAEVAFNDISGSAYGLYLYSGSTQRSMVHDNEVQAGTGYGMYLIGNVLAQNNRIHNIYGMNTGYGVYATSAVELLANEVYDSARGIYSSGPIRSNVVHGCQYYGIHTQDRDQIVEGNRVYDNAVGIQYHGGGQVVGNWVYSNMVGIQSGSSARGRIEGNVVYANDDAAIVLSGSSVYDIDVLSNTVYQHVGDAISLGGGAYNIDVFNNILWVDSGFCLYAPTGSVSGHRFDYNLYHTPFATGRLASWAGAVAADLPAWQVLGALDAHSLTGDPMFVDINGADDVLGYHVPLTGTPIHGALDDNFQLAAGSPAIDRGHSWRSAPSDPTGQVRRDDLGTLNAGSPDYSATVQPTSGFAAVGTAMNWRYDDYYWTLNLPFSFPLYDGSYASVRVGSNGFLYFGSDYYQSLDATNTFDELRTRPMIAPLWTDLRLDRAGDDIFVDTSLPGQVTVRWNATVKATEGDANFSVTLHSDGRIQFHYGAGNAGLVNPTVGISDGTGLHYLLTPYNGQASLSMAPSLHIAADTPGHVDIGAREFRGSTADTTPPTIVASTPPAVADAGEIGARTASITLTLSEPINEVDALASANYELRRASGEAFGAGDTLLSLLPAYLTGATSLELRVAQGVLPPGLYRLTVRGSAQGALHDWAGLALDGDGDGTPGGDWVREFRIAAPALVVTPEGPLTVGEDGTTATIHVRLAAQPAANVTVGLSVTDPAEAALSAASLLFTPANWDQPQTVTLHGRDDAVPDGDQAFFVLVGVLATTDPAYAALPGQQIAAVNVDDDPLDTAPPTVAAAAVNGGAIDRSMVRELSLQFSEPLAAPPTPADLRVVSLDAQQEIASAAMAVSYDPQTGLARLTFPGLPGGSLPDGNWRCTVIDGALRDAAGNALDGDGDGEAGGEYGLTFFRFFGDSDGNRTVDALDMLRFRSSYLRAAPDPAYNATFDSDSDGDVDAIDLLRMRQNYLQTLPEAPEASTPELPIDGGDPGSVRPPVRGDLTGDGVVNVDDVNTLLHALGAEAGTAAVAGGDLDGDGAVGRSDLDTLLRDILATEYGDANLDGRVDLDDLTLLGTQYGQAVTGWAQGDFTGDGVVDLDDLTILGTHYGFAAQSTASAPAPSAPATASASQDPSADEHAFATTAAPDGAMEGTRLPAAESASAPAPADAPTGDAIAPALTWVDAAPADGEAAPEPGTPAPASPEPDPARGLDPCLSSLDVIDVLDARADLIAVL